MNQAGISPRSAVLAVLAALACPVLPLVAAGQGTSTVIPDCVLQCRPWFLDPTTTECETDCLAKEVEIDFLTAQSAGEPYIPRFSRPDCGASAPCPYGAETFEYSAGAVVEVGAGLWSTATRFWMPGSAAVVQVGFSVAPVGSAVGVASLNHLPWQTLPAAHFDPLDGFWRTAWNTAGCDDPAGYFLRVEMLDALLGPIDAYTLGVDPKSCGFHSYGELAGGANTLELSASGAACAGRTAVLTTKQTSAPVVYTSVALAGDYLPILLGTVFVDLATQMLVLQAPATGGVAQVAVTFPPTPGLAGKSIYLQSLAFESGAPLGVAFSNALRITFCHCP